MQILKIQKPGTDKFRTLYCPDPELKRQLRALVPRLNLLAEELDTYGVQHGFTERRSPVTNAKAHIGWEFTASFDLCDFFDSVTKDHVCKACEGKLKVSDWTYLTSVFQDCFPDGAARQGLPTSPALANIAASPMDRDLMEIWKPGRFHDRPFVMTRYADDIAFSCHTMATVNLLLASVPKIVEKHGFRINEAKTKVQSAAAGRRIITGVAVGETDIAIPRSVRRRIRAGVHQVKTGLKARAIRRLLFKSPTWRRRLPLTARLRFQLRGMQEWAKLKDPKKPKERTLNVVAAAVVKAATVVFGQVTGEKLRAFARRFG